MAETEHSPEPTAKARNLSARLMAVQALYQAQLNGQSLESALEEYLAHRVGMEVEGEKMVAPDGALLKKILLGLAERRQDLEIIVQENYSNKNKEIELLLMAILLCGSYELMAHNDLDPPIIINDYLNVTHGFYGEAEVGLVNAVLDSIAGVIR